MTNEDLKQIIKSYTDDILSDKKCDQVIDELKDSLLNDEFSSDSKRFRTLKVIYDKNLSIYIGAFDKFSQFMKDAAEAIEKLTITTKRYGEIANQYLKPDPEKSKEQFDEDRNIFYSLEPTLKREMDYAAKEAANLTSQQQNAAHEYDAILAKGFMELQFIYEAFSKIRKYKLLIWLQVILIKLTPAYIKISYYLLSFYVTLRLDLLTETLTQDGISVWLIKPAIFLFSLFLLDFFATKLEKKLSKNLRLMILRELKINLHNKVMAYAYLTMAKKDTLNWMTCFSKGQTYK